jgi:hypothetical protein
MVLDYRRVKVREIAETIGISKERVGYILHEELDTFQTILFGVYNNHITVGNSGIFCTDCGNVLM